MAAVSVPSGKSLLGKLAGRPSKLAAFIANHTGTLAALGFGDAAAWHTGTTWGLIATAVCVLIADFKLQG